MNDIDQQVMDYLKRATTICDRLFYKYTTTLNKARDKQIIEIAKLIQLEEHHQFQVKGQNSYSKLEFPSQLIDYQDQDDI